MSIVSIEQMMNEYKFNEEYFVVELFNYATRQNIIDVSMVDEIKSTITSSVMSKIREIEDEDEITILMEDAEGLIASYIYIIGLYLYTFNPFSALKILITNRHSIVEKSLSAYSKRCTDIWTKITSADGKIKLNNDTAGIKEFINGLKRAFKTFYSFDKYPFESISDYSIDTSMLVKGVIYKTIYQQTSSGFLAYEKACNDILLEVEIISAFDMKNVSMVLSRAKERIFENLCELVIRQFVFSNLYSDTPRNLEISVVEAKLIIKELFDDGLTAEELIKNSIIQAPIDALSEDAKEYFLNYKSILSARIEKLKENKVNTEIFWVTEM